ncbi:MAG: hypothetical protein CL819_00940 [Croceicoccus sp.]|nr:hypothetical protein [Croceicoccus sp.]
MARKTPLNCRVKKAIPTMKPANSRREADPACLLVRQSASAKNAASACQLALGLRNWMKEKAVTAKAPMNAAMLPCGLSSQSAAAPCSSVSTTSG